MLYYKKLGDIKKYKEKTVSLSAIEFLYSNRIGNIFLFLIAKKLFSSLIGLYMKSLFSKGIIKKFISKYKIDMNDFVIYEWKSFNDFFKRKVKKNARPISKEGVCSPCDGKVYVQNLSKNEFFNVKGVKFNLDKFLQNKKLSNDFKYGLMIIIRLSPLDYHRFHFPFDCNILSKKKIAGKYYSVHPIALKNNLDIFLQNKREYTILKSIEKIKKKYREVLYFEIGATNVGSIVNTYTAKEFSCGQEKGFFEFGGSTVVLLFKKNEFKILKEIHKNSKEGYETEIKMGQKIGNFV